MLIGLIHFAECLAVAHWHEHRVIAEALVPARRPGELAVDPALEALHLAVVRPCERQGAGEMGIMAGILTGGFNFAPDAFHGAAEIALAVFVLGPTRGKNSRQAMQRINGKAAIVGEGRKAGKVRGLARLEVCIFDESVADLLGLG